jgi:hypothetical protein
VTRRTRRRLTDLDVVHDHIRLGQHQIVAVAYIGVRLARHVKHAGTTEGGETVGGSPCSGELSTSRHSSEMISDGCRDANSEVLIKGGGEHLLPTAQGWGVGLLRPPVAAPGTGNPTCLATSLHVRPWSRSSRFVRSMRNVRDDLSDAW